MSEDDRDIDIETDEEDSDSRQPRQQTNNQFLSQIRMRKGSTPIDTQMNCSPGKKKKGSEQNMGKGSQKAEKRAHHNALERKRRDHIKDSFSSLRESVPSLQGEKVVQTTKASRAQILKKAADYIQYMRRKNSSHQNDIDDLKRQNSLLESQIRTLEKAKSTGNFAAESNDMIVCTKQEPQSESDTTDSENTPTAVRRPKKLKVNGF